MSGGPSLLRIVCRPVARRTGDVESTLKEEKST
jgi:hypothetical protein